MPRPVGTLFPLSERNADQSGSTERMQVMDHSRCAETQAACKLGWRQRFGVEIAQDTQPGWIGHRLQGIQELVGHNFAWHNGGVLRARSKEHNPATVLDLPKIQERGAPISRRQNQFLNLRHFSQPDALRQLFEEDQDIKLFGKLLGAMQLLFQNGLDAALFLCEEN